LDGIEVRLLVGESLDDDALGGGIRKPEKHYG
jgi:hypothetical protein